MKKSEFAIMQANATKALREAVKEALKRHEAAGVPAVIWRDGKVVELPLRRRKSARRIRPGARVGKRPTRTRSSRLRRK